MTIEPRKVKHIRISVSQLSVEANWRDNDPPQYYFRYAGGPIDWFSSEQLRAIESMIPKALSKAKELEENDG
jgi:hypothetical protein